MTAVTVESGGEQRRRSGRRPFLIPSTIALFMVLILMIVGPIITDEGPNTGSGNLFRQISYAIVFFFTLWSARIISQPGKLLAVPISLLVAIGWCWLSLTWAVEPSISLRRLLLTTLIIWTIFLAVEDCGYDRTIRTCLIFLSVLLVANFVAIAVWPKAVHLPGESQDLKLIGDWRGLLPQKNFTGAICAMTVIMLMFGEKTMKPWLRWALLLATVFYLFKTQSKTSMGMLLIALGAGAAYWRLNPRLRAAAIPIVSITGVTAMMLLMKAWDETLGPFAQRDALTGRVQIWPAMIGYATDHPILGAGYGSFWNIGPSSPVYQYGRTWVAELSNGHNGYLDLLVQVGVPGLVLAVAATMIIPAFKLLASSSIARERGALLIAMIVFCAGHNMTETSLFERDTIIQVFLMLAVALTTVVTRRSGNSAPAGKTSKRRKASAAHA